jgi:DNA-binding LacI/PurR family transcriptional regulator
MNVKTHTTRRGRGPANLRQIAEELGVSVMTVSRALNGRLKGAEATRLRVLAAAERLKYRPNRLVHAIKSGRSHTVGVMISVRSSFNGKIIHGIHDALAKHNYLPVLHFHGVGPRASRDQVELKYLHRLLDQRVDGIIFWPSDETVSQMYLKEVWDRGLPLVAVDRRLPLTKADFSGTDDLAGGRLVAEHLLALGHRRLGHITGEPWVSTYADRRQGFEQTVARQRGVDLSVAECTKVDSGPAALAMLSQRDRPTAIFVPHDRMVPPIYEVAESLGLEIGRDVAVIGFGALEDMLWLRPRLATVDQQPYEIGRNAARLLLDRIEGRVTGDRARSVRITPTIVARQSIAAPNHLGLLP